MEVPVMQHRTLALVGLLAMVGLLGGCAAPARLEQMRIDAPLAVRAAAQSSPLKSNVAIKDVTGGQETNPMWKSNVSSSEFDRALEASLRDAGLLSLNRQAGTHALTAHLQKLDQPFAGISMTVTATVQYALVERSSGKEVWSRTVATPFTAEWNSAFVGTERLRLANEGAVRENLKQLIDQLSQLPANSIVVR
jgi:hypothetical protein